MNMTDPRLLTPEGAFSSLNDLYDVVAFALGSNLGPDSVEYSHFKSNHAQFVSQADLLSDQDSRYLLFVHATAKDIRHVIAGILSSSDTALKSVLWIRIRLALNYACDGMVACATGLKEWANANSSWGALDFQSALFTADWSDLGNQLKDVDMSHYKLQPGEFF